MDRVIPDGESISQKKNLFSHCYSIYANSSIQAALLYFWDTNFTHTHIHNETL
jgi:hypothetical protein